MKTLAFDSVVKGIIVKLAPGQYEHTLVVVKTTTSIVQDWVWTSMIEQSDVKVGQKRELYFVRNVGKDGKEYVNCALIV